MSAVAEGAEAPPELPRAVVRRRLGYVPEALGAILRGLDDDGFGCDPPGLLAEALYGLAHGLAAAGRPVELAIHLFARRLARFKPAVGLGWIEVESGAAGKQKGAGGGFWRPAPMGRGREAYLLPLVAWSPESRAECHEIIALDPQNPEFWWLRTKSVSVLGAAALDDALRNNAPITLVREPIAWARAGGESSGAVCLLDLAAPAAQAALLSVSEIRCADVAHGEAVKRLQQRLRPKLPKVMVAR